MLQKRLEQKKGRARLQFREKPLQPASADTQQDTEQRLPDDELLLTVGILRYGQSYRLQVLLNIATNCPSDRIINRRLACTCFRECLLAFLLSEASHNATGK